MPRALSRQSFREELGNNLQIALGTCLIGGALLGFLAAAVTVAQAPALLHRSEDVLRLLLGLQLIYAVLCLVLGIVAATGKSILYYATGRHFSDTKTAGVATWAAFFLLGSFYTLSWCRWHQVGGLSPDLPYSARHIPAILVIAALNAALAAILSYAFYILIVHVKKPERRRPRDLRRAFSILLYMGGAFIIFLVGLRLSSMPPTPTSGLTGSLVNPNGRKVLLLGLEGMEKEDFERLRSEGLLSWSRPLFEGARAPIPLPPDPIPPVIWTVIATGKDLSSHGILDFQTRMVKGLPSTFAIGPNQIGLFDLVHSVLPFFRMTRIVPVKSYMREAKGLWNMANDADLRTVVVNWWVSWPAERVRGAVVSDHAWLKLTGPVQGAEEYAESGMGTGADGGARPAERNGDVSQSFARSAASVQTQGSGMQGAMSAIRPDGAPLVLERETWPSTLLMELSVLAGDSLPDTLAARYGGLPSPEASAVFERWKIPVDVLRSDLFYAQSAGWLLDREQPDLWMLHLPGPDIIRRVLSKNGVPAALRKTARGEALRAYWQTVDPAVEAALRAAGREERVSDAAAGNGSASLALTVLVDLPGFHASDEENSEGAGVFAIAGPGVRSNELATPVRLTEITPTLLWLLGLPSSREMDGEPRTDPLLTEAAGSLSPVQTIPSYGRQETSGLEQAAGTLDQEMMERFRSLGYIR